MRIKTGILLAVLVALLAAPVVTAHHSTAMYDMEHPSTFKGIVSRVEWTNPHGYIYLNVKNDKGSVDEWAMEINSPNFLRHNGWTSSTVSAGDTIICTGAPAKSGSKFMHGMSVELSSGVQLRS